MNSRLPRPALVACIGLLSIQCVAETIVPAAARLDVSLPATLQADAAGRLLIFAERERSGPAPQKIDAKMDPESAVAARDVATFGPARRAAVDLDHADSSKPFSALPPGKYRVQAVLDQNADYARSGRGSGDLVSNIVTIQLPMKRPVSIALDHAIPGKDLWNSPDIPQKTRELRAAAKPYLTSVEIPSPSLTQFWGRAISMRAWVLVPPEYDPAGARTWPTIFRCGEFPANVEWDLDAATLIAEGNKARAMPPMIWVFLDYATTTGATEFVDSVNNGPWARALLTEFIPALEQRFRMDAHPLGRFLTGRSSGGWSALWLQVHHPDVFNGAWVAAPDPSDFRDFVGVDLYAPNANMFYDERRNLRPLARVNGQVVVTIRDAVAMEDVLGHAGGQFGSFDWVFSPRGATGTPLRMFNHITGAIDPAVVSYWREHFDIARAIAAQPAAAKLKLDGKIRLVVGDADTFYLDGSAHRLQEAMTAAGVAAEFRFLPGKTHYDIWERDGDPVAELKDMARSMYAVARPK